MSEDKRNTEISPEPHKSADSKELGPQRKFDNLRNAFRSRAEKVLSRYAVLRKDTQEDTDSSEMAHLHISLIAAETRTAQELAIASEEVEDDTPDHEIVTLKKGGELFDLNMPLYTKPFKPMFKSKEKEQDFDVYADFELPDQQGGLQKIAIVKRTQIEIDQSQDDQLNNFQALSYIEPDGGVREYSLRDVTTFTEGYSKNFYPNLLVNYVGGNLFKITSEDCKATVPDQTEKEVSLAELAASGNPIANELLRKQRANEPDAKPTLHAEPIDLDERNKLDVIKTAAERFPENVVVGIKLHRGGYEADEEYEAALIEQIKGSWVVFAEGLGIDPQDFPMKEIDIWAPPIEDKTRGTHHNRMRNALHQRRITVKNYQRGMAGGFKPGRMGLRDKINMPVPESGVLNFGTTAHELFHSYLYQRDAFANASDNKGYERVINEGMATIANKIIVARSLSGEKAPINNTRDFENEFIRFIDAIQDTDTPSSPSEPKPLVREAYNPANAALHLYLLNERGGLEQIKAVTEQTMTERNEFLAAYEHVYGEPFVDLALKAKDWFKSHNLQQKTS
jgi:hypothetical protein